MPSMARLIDRIHRLRRRLTRRPDQPNGALLISSGGLGDSILFSLVAPNFAKLAREDEKVTVVVQKASEAVGFLFTDPIEIVSLNYRRFVRNPFYRYRFLDRIFLSNFRLAISTDHLRLPTVDDALIAATDAPQTFALRPRSWAKHNSMLMANRSIYTDWVEPSPGMAHRMVRWTELISALSDHDIQPAMVRFEEHLIPSPPSRKGSYVVLHPFSSERVRTPNLDTWTALVEELQRVHEIIFSIGPGDLDRYPDFVRLTERPGIDIDTGTLREKLGLMRGAHMIVTVDTSVMHLAVGSGAKTLCLASAAHIIDSVPYDRRMTPDNVTFFYENMPCAGCLGDCIHPLVDGRYACIDALSAERIVAKVRELL